MGRRLGWGKSRNTRFRDYITIISTYVLKVGGHSVSKVYFCPKTTKKMVKNCYFIILFGQFYVKIAIFGLFDTF